jgi:hypothetical protein
MPGQTMLLLARILEHTTNAVLKAHSEDAMSSLIRSNKDMLHCDCACEIREPKVWSLAKAVERIRLGSNIDSKLFCTCLLGIFEAWRLSTVSAQRYSWISKTWGEDISKLDTAPSLLGTTHILLSGELVCCTSFNGGRPRAATSMMHFRPRLLQRSQEVCGTCGPPKGSILPWYGRTHLIFLDRQFWQIVRAYFPLGPRLPRCCGILI